MTTDKWRTRVVQTICGNQNMITRHNFVDALHIRHRQHSKPTNVASSAIKRTVLKLSTVIEDREYLARDIVHPSKALRDAVCKVAALLKIKFIIVTCTYCLSTQRPHANVAATLTCLSPRARNSLTAAHLVTSAVPCICQRHFDPPQPVLPSPTAKNASTELSATRHLSVP